MRILFATSQSPHELCGAPQVFLRLLEALKEEGAEVVTWYPQGLESLRWWQLHPQTRRQLQNYLSESGSFDVIDCRADLIPKMPKHQTGLVVARSNGPHLEQLVLLLKDYWLRNGTDWRALLRSCAATVETAYEAVCFLSGLARADLILCLGSKELSWYHQHFPAWRTKLRRYNHCPSSAEQEALAKVRSSRTAGSRKIIWIGRWAATKGTELLEKHLRVIVASKKEMTITVAGFHSMDELALAPALLQSERIKFLPQFSRAELPKLLAEHDIGLVTSKSEGWGLVLNEMLEAGMTVYSTDAGAFADLKPYFPTQLMPLGEPGCDFEPGDLQADLTDYYQLFTWRAIARDYLEMCEKEFAKRSTPVKQGI